MSSIEIEKLRVAAESGDAAAQCDLASKLVASDADERDLAEAHKWFLLSAEKGNVEAQYEMGTRYFARVRKGEGNGENNIEAAKWLRKASEQGKAMAQYELGLLGQLYGYGKGDVEGDDLESVRWFHVAAKQGFAEAQSYLGKMYLIGADVEQDDLESFQWYVLAARQGDEEALCSAQRLFKIMMRDAEQGNAVAQYRIGRVYNEGIGVKKDSFKAEDWLCRAAKQGHDHAKQEYERVKLSNLLKLLEEAD